MTSTSIYECITEKVIAKFKPTRLYIKRHSITGLQYFGKTSKVGVAFEQYKGSGKHWSRHIKKHGKEHVETTWVSEIYTVDKIDELVEFALFFSEFNNIVDSNDWANLIHENGLDGSPLGKKYTSEQNAANSARQKGRKNDQQSKRLMGKKHSPERRDQQSKRLIGKTRTPEAAALYASTFAANKAAGLHSTEPHALAGKKWTADQREHAAIVRAAKKAAGHINSNIGKKRTPEQNAAKSAQRAGVKLTQEQLISMARTRAANKAAGLHSKTPVWSKGKKLTQEQLAARIGQKRAPYKKRVKDAL